jgi:hypothetical protein
MGRGLFIAAVLLFIVGNFLCPADPAFEAEYYKEYNRYLYNQKCGKRISTGDRVLFKAGQFFSGRLVQAYYVEQERGDVADC